MSSDQEGPRTRLRVRRAWTRSSAGESDASRADRSRHVAFEPRDLIGLFAPPKWLHDLGTSAWLAVGVTLFLVGAVWLLSLTRTIVLPLITAAVVAAVTSPVVRWLDRHGIRRALGTALVLLGLIALAALLIVVVLVGITSQTGALRVQLTSAQQTLVDWLSGLGVDRDTAEAAKNDLSAALGKALPALLQGLRAGLNTLSSLVVFLGLMFLSTFFLLKDGPQIRHWAEGHMRVPRGMAHGISERLLESLRGYFVGVTWVAAFNAVVVWVGAVLLGVPLAGSIACVVFVGAYVPYLGAWGAGMFSVAIALGGAGTDAAIGMIILQLLANGILQQLVQPIAYGAALGIHPLAVLVVTIAGGGLFGAVGLILAAPLTAAAMRISADLSRGRAETSAAASEEMTTPASRPEAAALP